MIQLMKKYDLYDLSFKALMIFTFVYFGGHILIHIFGG